MRTSAPCPALRTSARADTSSRGHPAGQRGAQVLTTIALAMNHLELSASVAFAGAFTEQVTAAGADVALSSTEISWVCSVTSIGNMVGFLISSYVNPVLGAVRVCQLCAPLVAAACVIVAVGSSFWTLFAGRLILGVFNGITYGPTNTHIGEIASPELRGVLTSLMITIDMLGITCTYVAGWLLGWRRMCLVMGIAPMAFTFAVTLLLPRSPRWLVTRGHPLDEAKHALRFYFGQDHDVASEIQAIQESLGDGHKHNASIVHALGRLRHRYIRVPFLLVIAVQVFMVFSGGHTTTAFAPVIFSSVGLFSNPYIGSILVGAVRLVAAIICSSIINKLHRRTLLVVNAVVGGIGCLLAGCYFQFAQLSAHAWLPLASLLSVVFAMSLGVSPMKSVLFSELLSNSIRSELGGVCLLVAGAFSFVMVYTFPLAVQAVGMAWVYWFFTFIHLLLLAYSIVCLPDTNGKTIEQIQKLFEKTAKIASNVVSVDVEQPKMELGEINRGADLSDGVRKPTEES